MDLKQSQQVRKYIDIIMRRKVVIISCLLLSIGVGLVINVITPRTYQAEALLSYQEQKVNPARMSPDVQGKIREMVGTLTQIVTSRTNLENVIKNFDLYTQARKELPMEDVVDNMRKHIEIKPSPRGDTFSITFEGGNPSQVVKVTNSLAAKFIEENIKYREERATETSSYTKNELQMAKVVLDKKEEAMKDYKLKYYNEMPDQREANLGRLSSLQLQYQSQQGSIQDFERTRVMLQEQITARKNLLGAERASMEEAGDKNIAKGNAVPGETDAQRLERMREVYKSLLIKYTEKHPEVIRVRKIIEKLEQTVGKETSRGGKSGRSLSIMETDPVLLQLSLQMKKLEIDVENLNREKQQTKDLIKKYEEWVSEAPVREAEWSGLTREYGELKKHYDFLVTQDLQAESALRLEQKQKGSQFRIEDSARLPEKPIRPNFYKIMGVAIMFGLISGFGIAMGELFLDSSFKDVDDIESFLDLQVVCSIPFITTEREQRREKRVAVGWTMALAASAGVLVVAFLFLWQHGRIIL